VIGRFEDAFFTLPSAVVSTMYVSARTLLLIGLLAACITLVPAAPVLMENIGMGWADSFSIGGKCYCHTSFDHNIGNVMVKGPGGKMVTVVEACALVGTGPESIGSEKRKYYNDIQVRPH
jgi:hypothetical protein